MWGPTRAREQRIHLVAGKLSALAQRLRNLLDLTLGRTCAAVSREIETAGRDIGREILIVKAANEREPNAAFETVVQAGARALLVRGSPLFNTRRRQLVALAARHALLASYASRDYPEVGGLMSYGPSITDAYRRAGIYVGRVLKGTRPDDLPVEMAMKFDLVINLATAKAIDLDIPITLLARADEVIE